jgi:flagellar hook-length control protein FliK
MTHDGRTEEATFILEDVEAMPNLKEDLLKQIRAGFPDAEQNARIVLTPPELGEIRIQFTMDSGFPSVSLTASEGLVRHLLEQGIDQLKNLFKATAVKVDAHMPSIEAQQSPAGEAALQSTPLEGPPRAEGFKIEAPPEPVRPETLPAEQEISRRHDIRDVHRHILDQIRVKVDPTRNEARIRLHPPELGDIKIHMVMDDHRLTVRMEVSENVTRTLLERDLDQLKEALAEAGIDVGRFDIHSQEERASKGKKGTTGKEGNARDDADSEGDEGGFGGSRMISGSIQRLAVPIGVDYLVY